MSGSSCTALPHQPITRAASAPQILSFQRLLSNRASGQFARHRGERPLQNETFRNQSLMGACFDSSLLFIFRLSNDKKTIFDVTTLMIWSWHIALTALRSDRSNIETFYCVKVAQYRWNKSCDAMPNVAAKPVRSLTR